MAQIESLERQFYPIRNGPTIQALHHRQRLAIEWSSERAKISIPDDASFTLRTRQLSRGPQPGPPLNQRAQPCADQHRAERVLGPGLAEWFVNKPRGLEHGYTIDQPPAESDASGNTIRLAIDLGMQKLEPVLASPHCLNFLNAGGEVAAQYSELYVFDAKARHLPAWFELNTTDDELAICYDDTDAVYPVRVDPLIVTYPGPDFTGAANERLGASVSIWGDLCAVGRPSGYNTLVPLQSFSSAPGKVDIYQILGQWQKVATIDDPEGVNRNFGLSLHLKGDRLAVGAPDDAPGNEAAFVFERDPIAGTWAQVDKLTDPTGNPVIGFGHAVQFFGDEVAVGSPFDGKGQVHIFAPEATGGYAFDRSYAGSGGDSAYGWSLAANDRRQLLAVGAPLTSRGPALGLGRVHIITDSGTVALDSPHSAPDSYFGYAVAASEANLAVGTPVDDAFSANFGLVFLYDFEAGDTPIQTLAPASPVRFPCSYGFSLALEGRELMVGGPLCGYVELLVKEDLFFNRVQVLTPPSGLPDPGFGSALGISGLNMVIANASASPNFLPQPDGEITFYRNSFGARSEDTSSLPFAQGRVEIDADGGFLAVGLPENDSVTIFPEQEWEHPYRWGIPLALDNPSPPNSSFGSALDLDGVRQRLIVAAPEYSPPGESGNGAFAIFEVVQGEWRQVYRDLSAPNQARFAKIVTIDGHLAAVGSPEHSGPTVSGAIQVLRRDETGQWQKEQSMIPGQNIVVDEIPVGWECGTSLALNAARNLLLVGAPGAYSDKGAVLVFSYDRVNAQWTLDQTIRNTDPNTKRFGTQVAERNGEVAVLCQKEDPVSGSNRKLIRFYHQISQTSFQERGAVESSSEFKTIRYLPNNRLLVTRDQGFGFGVDDVLSVSPHDRSLSSIALIPTNAKPVMVSDTLYAGTPTGSVVRVRQAASWGRVNLLSTDRTDDYHFGESLDLGGGRLAVGAPAADSAFPGFVPGAVYVFEKMSDATWGNPTRITAEDRERHLMFFGADLVFNGDWLATVGGNPNGEWDVYAFNRRSDGTWVREAILLPHQAVAGDDTGFGQNLLLHGNQLFVTAPTHDFDLDFNGSQEVDAGAVYVTELWPGNVLQGRTITALNQGAANQKFGTGLAADGGTLVVGAAGGEVVHLFHNGPVGWVPRGTVAPAAPQPGAGFGTAIAIKGEFLAVGEPGRDLTPALVDAGRVTAYKRRANGWNRIYERDGDLAGDQLGHVLDMQGNQLAMGVPLADLLHPGGGFVADAGVVILATLIDFPVLGDDRFLTAGSNSAAQGEFGKALKFQGNWLAMMDNHHAYTINWSQEGFPVPIRDAYSDSASPADIFGMDFEGTILAVGRTPTTEHPQGSVVVFDLRNHRQRWHSQQFTDAHLNAPPESDLDADGTPRELEYLGGLNPQASDSNQLFPRSFRLVRDRNGTDHWSFQFQRSLGADRSMTYSVSNDLRTWQDIPSAKTRRDFSLERTAK